MRTKTAACLALLAALAALAAACGGEADTAPQPPAPAAPAEPAEPPADGGRLDVEGAWLALLAERGLEPREGVLELTVASGDGVLTVGITVVGSEQVTFADGLYGAEAFTLTADGWERVDTADVRTEIAPLLDPGQSATVELPVRDAGTYRALVPILPGGAAWADLA
jgi:hypothetical protein